MVQYTIIKSDLMSPVAQAEMAVAAGCEWVELDMTGYSAEETEDIASSVIPACKEGGVILVFKHHDVLVDRLRVHGITLSKGDAEALELRKRLGGHVIIGIEYSEDIEWTALKRADVDYIVVDGATASLIESLNRQAQAVGSIPIVARGNFSTDEMYRLHTAGAAGFNIDIHSLIGPNLRDSLTHIIKYCNELRG